MRKPRRVTSNYSFDPYSSIYSVVTLMVRCIIKVLLSSGLYFGGFVVMFTRKNTPENDYQIQQIIYQIKGLTLLFFVD